MQNVVPDIDPINSVSARKRSSPQLLCQLIGYDQFLPAVRGGGVRTGPDGNFSPEDYIGPGRPGGRPGVAERITGWIRREGRAMKTWVPRHKGPAVYEKQTMAGHENPMPQLSQLSLRCREQLRRQDGYIQRLTEPAHRQLKRAFVSEILGHTTTTKSY